MNIAAKYASLALGGISLGFPTSLELAVGNTGGRMQSYTGGNIYSHPEYGTFAVYGPILNRYLEIGGPEVWGVPTSDVVKGPGSGEHIRLAVQGGGICYSPASGAVIVHGLIGEFYWSKGGPSSSYGYPTGDEQDSEILASLASSLTLLKTERYSPFEGGVIAWSSNMGTVGLSNWRIAVFKQLDRLLPCDFMDSKYTRNIYVPHSKRMGTYSTCGTLPAGIAYPIDPYANSEGLKLGAVTTGLAAAGRRRAAWVDYSEDLRPKPGDFYALVKGAKADSNIKHVGVVVSPFGTEWLTADMGQNGGYGGRIGVKRKFDPATGTLTGEAKDNRPLFGWIDVDSFFSWKRS